MELAAVRMAGRAQAVISVCATRFASNMEPARMASVSVTRAGMESTALSVRAIYSVCVCEGGGGVNALRCAPSSSTQSN